MPTPFFCLIKKLTVIGINGYTHGVRQVAKPTPKAIKKKLNNDFSSSGFSAELILETKISEESETATGVEVVTESAAFVLSVLVMVEMVEEAGAFAVVFRNVVCEDPDNGNLVVSFTWVSVWSLLFFFKKHP